MYIVLRWFLNAVAILIVAHLVKGIEVQGFAPAFIAAVVLGLVNTFIRPVILFLTLPFNVMTLGLFTFVINGLLLLLVSSFVPDFHVDGLIAATFGSILISLVSFVLNLVFRPDRP